MAELFATGTRLLLDTDHPAKVVVRVFAIVMTVITIILSFRVILY
jgi:hypothetical protein